MSRNKSTSPHHVQRDWWRLVPTQINIPTPCAKRLVGGCPKTNQRPYTMCKGIGGGFSQHKSTSPHHVPRDRWGRVPTPCAKRLVGGGVPTQIKLPTPCVKGLVGACPKTNQRRHTMCKAIGGGLSQYKSNSPHHVQKGLVGACPNTNQTPHTMCKGIGGGLSQHKSTSPHHVQRDWWGLSPKQIKLPTPCVKGLVGACPKTNQRPHTMCKGIGGGLSQYKSNSPHHVQRDWWGLVPTQINVPTPCAKGSVGACPHTMCKRIGGGGCPNTNQTPHTMCKGIGGGLSQNKSTSPHHVQSDWWGLVPIQIKLPRPCAKGIGGGLSQYKSNSPHHVQRDWWGLVPTQINIPTPCAKGLVGAFPKTNQTPHTMCKGIGGGLSQNKSTSPHHVQRDWWGFVPIQIKLPTPCAKGLVGGGVPTQIKLSTPCAKRLVGACPNTNQTPQTMCKRDWWGLVPIQIKLPTPCAKGLVGACPNTNQHPHTMCKGIGGGFPQNKSNSPHHVQRDWWGLVPKQINVPTPCAKGLVGACPNTNQTRHTMCKGIGGGGCPNTNQTLHTMCKGIGGGLSQHKSTSPHHVQRDWWGGVAKQINVPTPCAKGLVGACPNTNQRPHTMCKGIGGGVSQNKSASPHHVQRDWWGLVPTQINVPTPCAKRLVGGCRKTNQRPHTMCKGIGGGLSQHKSTSPHHVQKDWWGGVAKQINVPTPCAKGLVGACPNTNQRPHTMCKAIGGGVSQNKSTSPHHVQRDWWGLVPTQINVPTPCAKGSVGACPHTMCKGIGGGGCPNTNQTPHTMCKGIGGGLSQHKSTSPHHVQRDWWGLVPIQIKLPTPCAKGLVGGVFQHKSTSPHHVQRDWWGLVPTQMNVPTPCAKRLVGACPNTNQRPHTMCKAVGGGLSQHKSTSPHHVQRDWWGLVPTQINVPTPCAKRLVGACPNTNQRPHTMCKGIGGGLSQNKSMSPHHVQRDWWGGVSQHKSTSPHHVQRDWWGLVPTQINVPTPCAKRLVGAFPKTNQPPHTMCKGIGGGLSQHKSTFPHHVQRDWWGLSPTEINVPTPCVKGLVGACPKTNQRPHTM